MEYLSLMNDTVNDAVLDFLPHFIADFVVSSHRPRLLYLLERPKRRYEIIAHFHTDYYFDERCLHPVSSHTPHNQMAAEIYKTMLKLGATQKCLAFSGLETLNGEFGLKEALIECVGFSVETILYCQKNKVAYWEGGHGDRCIFHKSTH